MHQITTIGDLDISPEAMSTSQIFAGATNRTQIAAYMGALSWEKFAKGFTGGVLVGAAAAVALAFYLKKG